MSDTVFTWSMDESGTIWQPWSPRKEKWPQFENGEVRGTPLCFGGYRTYVPLDGGGWFRFEVTFASDRETALQQHVLCLLLTDYGSGPADAVNDFTRNADGTVTGKLAVKLHPQAKGVTILFGLRYCENTVKLLFCKLKRTQALPPRKARIGVCRWWPNHAGSRENYLAQTAELLDQAGVQNADLMLLTEAVNLWSPSLPFGDMAEDIPGGAGCRLASEKARQYGMYVCICLSELEGGHLYTTAALFGRDGAYIGKYRKTHLYFPEELEHGVTPGEDWPVFDLDFGHVGIVICYDSWFPESFRLPAMKGAELILFPNAGHEPKLIPARAIDSCVYVANSAGSCAQVVDTMGNNVVHGTEYGKVLVGEIDLNHRPLPHANGGGNMMSAPGGKRCSQNTLSNRIFADMSAQAEVWEQRGTVPNAWC
ncbi:MAG: carbon-nitrogen hydrolase family protein [Oscillospiraceae bacterium]|jgi:predicted amidohydrolase|nr:carbon-nitrogen hydrolase family protein [Oscillospiraceae bacterium]